MIIIEQKKENLKVQCKCSVVQVLSSSKMCVKFALKPRKLPGLIQITDQISYINH